MADPAPATGTAYACSSPSRATIPAMTDDERAEVKALHKQNSELLEIMSAIPWGGEGDTAAWMAAKDKLDVNMDRITQIVLGQD